MTNNYYSKETVINTFKAVYEYLTMESDVTIEQRCSICYDALKGLVLFWNMVEFETTPEWDIISRGIYVKVWAKTMGLLLKREYDEAVAKIADFLNL